MPNVTLLFFGALQEQTGRKSLQWTINRHTTVGDVLDNMKLSGPVLCAVNHQQVDTTKQLRAGDELALMPPMAGG